MRRHSKQPGLAALLLAVVALTWVPQAPATAAPRICDPEWDVFDIVNTTSEPLVTTRVYNLYNGGTVRGHFDPNNHPYPGQVTPSGALTTWGLDNNAPGFNCTKGGNRASIDFSIGFGPTAVGVTMQMASNDKDGGSHTHNIEACTTTDPSKYICTIVNPGSAVLTAATATNATITDSDEQARLIAAFCHPGTFQVACAFTPSAAPAPVADTAYVKVGGEGANYTEEEITHEVVLEHTTGLTTSVAVAASLHIDLFKVVDIGLKAKFGRGVTNSQSFGVSEEVAVRPGCVGYVKFTTPTLAFSGDMTIDIAQPGVPETHLKLTGVTFFQPDPNGTGASGPLAQSRSMSKTEKADPPSVGTTTAAAVKADTDCPIEEK